MKTTAIATNYHCTNRHTACRYPNSAQRRHFGEQLLDTVLAAAITLAVVVILLFLLALA